MILLLLLGLALAQEAEPPPRDPVWLDAHASVLSDLGRRHGPGLGGGLAVGRAPLLFELRADVAAVPDGPRVALWPGLRLHLVDVQRAERWRPALTAGLGLQAGGSAGLRRVLVMGTDLDAPVRWSPFRSKHLRPRVGAWAETDLNGAWLGGLRAGVVWAAGGRARTEPVPDEDPLLIADDGIDPSSPGDGDPAGLDTTDGSSADPTEGSAADPTALQGPWWDPVACEWVDEDPGYGWRPIDGAGLPGSAAGAPGSDASATGTGRQGWLVVVAEPGAVVRLPGIDQTVGSEGAVRLTAAEGVVDVEVVGGGRVQTFEAAIADGFVLWLRASPPEEVAVQFASGSAEVDEADRVAAQALARNRGQYRLQLTGSFSPEGDRAQNLDLARRRAEAVRALLEEVGVPADHLEVLPPTPPRPGLTAAQQRAVFVQPVSPPEDP